MKRLLLTLALPLVLSFAMAGCAAETGSDDATASTEELRSVASGFYLKQPFAGARMETLRTSLGAIDEQGTFVRNYHLSAGVHFDTKSAHLSDAERADVIQAAYAFWMSQNDPSVKSKKWAKGLAPAADLASALDGIGLEVDSPDPAADAARAALDKTLASVAATKNVTVWKATLPKEDMYWYGLLVVVDEDKREILFETGGYGN